MENYNKKCNSFEKIENYLQDIQHIIYEAQENEEFSELSQLNDITMEFLVDYKYYGNELDTNILQINFAGTSDWCYMFSIPKEEYENKSYLNDLETYPIYFVCFESGHIKKNSNNFREFIEKIYDGDVEQFSKITKKQKMPKFTKILDEIE